MAEPETALITGLSYGISAAYADRLAKRGYDLVLVARNEERLRAVAKQVTAESHVKVGVLTADLTSRADVRRAEQRLRSDASLTLLVNNAGIGTPKRVLGEGVDWLEGAVELNVVTVHRLAIAAAQTFVARGHGGINLRITTSFRQGYVTCATRPARRPNHDDIPSDHRELYRTPRRSVEMRLISAGVHANPAEASSSVASYASCASWYSASRASKAHPMAATICGSWGTWTANPSRSRSRSRNDAFRATPPMNTTSAATPTLSASVRVRVTMESAIPLATLARGTPRPISPTTSDSANTAQVLLIEYP